jgi:hypothetical protein
MRRMALHELRANKNARFPTAGPRAHYATRTVGPAPWSSSTGAKDRVLA